MDNKNISPFAEQNAGYVTWVHMQCAWTITAPQETQAWSQNAKGNFYIYLYIKIISQAMRKISSHVSVLLKQHCLFIWFLLLLKGYFGFLKWLMLFPLVWILIVFWHFHLFLYFLNKDCYTFFLNHTSIIAWEGNFHPL